MYLKSEEANKYWQDRPGSQGLPVSANPLQARPNIQRRMAKFAQCAGSWLRSHACVDGMSSESGQAGRSSPK